MLALHLVIRCPKASSTSLSQWYIPIVKVTTNKMNIVYNLYYKGCCNFSTHNPVGWIFEPFEILSTRDTTYQRQHEMCTNKCATLYLYNFQTIAECPPDRKLWKTFYFSIDC